MTGRPYVLLSAAVSLDGYLDDTGPERLLLSDAPDFDRVDALRAECDAILAGAGTLRADDPRLLVRDPDRRAARVAAGLPEHPLRVTLTARGDLDPGLRLWRVGGDRLVYAPDAVVPGLRERLAARAGDEGRTEVAGLGARVEPAALLADLGARGVRRLLVEGGGRVHSALLSGGLADELRLAVAPLVLGEEGAPRMLYPGHYPADRLRLVEVGRVGRMALLRYRCSDRDDPAVAKS
jgi:riboflavin-specific deaminase-like protein